MSFAGSTQYHVHCGVLSKYKKLDAGYDTWKGYVNLSDVPEQVGCTIIHYLYSGTLENHIGLDASLQVYCVAQRYSIHELAQLAKKRANDAALGSPSRVLEIIQGATKLFTEDDRWLDGLVQVQSRHLLQTELVQRQDSFQALLSLKDRVSKILLQEMLLRCDRQAAETPTVSDIDDECLVVQDSLSININDTIGSTLAIEERASKPRFVQSNKTMPSNAPQEEVLDAGIPISPDVIELPEPKKTKRGMKKTSRAEKEHKRREEEETLKEEVKRLRDAGCLCEWHGVHGCHDG